MQNSRRQLANVSQAFRPSTSQVLRHVGGNPSNPLGLGVFICKTQISGSEKPVSSDVVFPLSTYLFNDLVQLPLSLRAVPGLFVSGAPRILAVT